MADDAIVKAGCSIDQDLMELYLYSIYQHGNDQGAATKWRTDHHQHSKGMQDNGLILEARSRLDLGGIRLVGHPTFNETNANNNTVGLKTLAAEILGVKLDKPRRLAISDWSRVPLSANQIAYSARDAWASAAVVAELGKRGTSLPSYSSSSSSPSPFSFAATTDTSRTAEEQLLSRQLLVTARNRERSIRELVQRQSKRKRAQRILKKFVYHHRRNRLRRYSSWRWRVLQHLKTVLKENKYDAPTIFEVKT